MPRHPASDAFARAQFYFSRRRRKILRRVNLQKIGRRIDERQRAGRRPHHPHRLAHDQLQRLLRIQRGVDDVADLIQQAQTLWRQFRFMDFLTHLKQFLILNFEFLVQSSPPA